MRWPFVRRKRFEDQAAGLAQALRNNDQAWKEVKMLSEVNEVLTRKCARAYADVDPLVRENACLKLGKDEAIIRYAELARRSAKVTMEPHSDERGLGYAILVALRPDAPALFGNGDAAAWDYYSEVIAREVAIVMKQSKFVVKMDSMYIAPLASKPAGS